MVISRVIIRVTPFKALITLLITYLLSPREVSVRDKGLERVAACSVVVLLKVFVFKVYGAFDSCVF